MRPFLMFVAAVCTTVLLVGCGADSAEKEENQSSESSTASQEMEISEEEKIEEDKVVAKINGTEISGAMYNFMYVRAKMQMSQADQDIDDQETIQELTIDALIDQELLKQDAKKLEIEVSDEEAQAEFDAIKSEDEENFNIFIEENHLTEEAFKDQLLFAMIHDKYLDSEMGGIEVSEKEIEDTYEELEKDNEDFPELKEIEDQLRKELTHLKKQEELQTKMKELKEDAEIETMI